MPQDLDFQETVSALQALLGQVVSVTIGSFASGNEAGMAGALGYAQRRPDDHLPALGANEDHQVYTFFLTPTGRQDRAWFTINERSFQWGLRQERTAYTDGRVGQTVTVASTGTNIVVAVPTSAALEEAGWQPEE